MKTFRIEFLCFPGIECKCVLCGELVKHRQEEIMIPALSYGQDYQGALCEACYRDLPDKVNSAIIQKFGG